MHHMRVLHVAVCKNDLVDLPAFADFGQFLLVDDGDAAGISGPCQRGRINAACDPRYLRRREGDDLAIGAIPEDDVEIVKVAAGRAHNDDAPALCHLRHGAALFLVRPQGYFVRRRGIVQLPGASAGLIRRAEAR